MPVSHKADSLVGMAFRIAQISDTHLSAGKPFFVANFMRVAEALAADPPDLVLNSGDISLNGADCEADLIEARRLHDALQMPVRYVPGNHDIGDNQDVPGAHDHPVIDGVRRARYRQHFGADWWCQDVPGWRLLAVNAQLIGSDLDAALEQEEFIAETVANARERRVALFIHKPICDRAAGESTIGGRFLNPAPRHRLLAALGKCRPDLIACGHVHQYRATRTQGTDHVWAPSTAFVLPDARQPQYGLKQVGYVVHQLHADGRRDSRMATAPDSVNLDITDFPAAYGPLT